MLDADPVASCMVASRVETVGVEPWRLGGELWGVGGRLDGLCFSGANLVPLRGERAAVRSFAERARRHRRTCSSLVGRRELVLPLWEELSEHWGAAREVRPDQPLMATDSQPVDHPRPRRPAGPPRRHGPLPPRGDRDVPRGGRGRPAGRGRRRRLPGAGGGADLVGPGVRALRERRGRVQGRGRGPLDPGRPDPGRVGAPRVAGARARAGRDRRGRRPPGAGRPDRVALRQRVQQPGPAPPTRGSGSSRWRASRRSSSSARTPR